MKNTLKAMEQNKLPIMINSIYYFPLYLVLDNLDTIIIPLNFLLYSYNITYYNNLNPNLSEKLPSLCPIQNR